MFSKKGKVFVTRRHLVKCVIALNLLTIGAAQAEIGTTPQITIINGTNSNNTPASWGTWGALDYYSSDYGYQIIHYGWPTINSSAQYFYGNSDYVDAPIYHRRVLVYTPDVLIWESCSQDAMDMTVLPSSGLWHRQGYATPNPTDWYGSSQNDVIYKVQSGGTTTALSATQFTLKKTTN